MAPGTIRGFNYLFIFGLRDIAGQGGPALFHLYLDRNPERGRFREYLCAQRAVALGKFCELGVFLLLLYRLERFRFEFVQQPLVIDNFLAKIPPAAV